MPQPFGSFGGQVGTGIAEVLAMILFDVAALPVFMEATAPVTTRESANARTKSFMV